MKKMTKKIELKDKAVPSKNAKKVKGGPTAVELTGILVSSNNALNFVKGENKLLGGSINFYK